MRQQAKNSGFDPRKTLCSYAMDSRHFSVTKDYTEPISVVDFESDDPGDEDYPMHGVEKDKAHQVGALQIQGLREIGGIVPALKPFELKEDLMKVLGILCPLRGPPTLGQLSRWMESSSISQQILGEKHACGEGKLTSYMKNSKWGCISVPVVIVSNLIGAQCIHLRVPACRIASKPLRHFHSAIIVIGETLSEEILFLVKGYSMHRLFGVIQNKLSVEKIARAEGETLSENFQLLSMLFSEI